MQRQAPGYDDLPDSQPNRGFFLFVFPIHRAEAITLFLRHVVRIHTNPGWFLILGVNLSCFTPQRLLSIPWPLTCFRPMRSFFPIP